MREFFMFCCSMRPFRSIVVLSGFYIWFSLTVVGSAAAQSRIPFPATVPEALGVNIHFADPKSGEMKMLAASGVKWVRMDLHWAGTERQKGKYDFSEFDRLLKALDVHKLRAVLILDYSNPLYEANQSVVTDEGRQAYARWAAAAVTHFKGRKVFWEVWNEPDLQNFWKPEPNVEHYIAMAKAACVAMRKAAPQEIIVGPACSTTRPDFLEPCFQGGLLEYWDAVSVHPYRQGAPESVAIEYHRLRNLIAKYAPPGKNVALLSGEWGYSTTWNQYDEDRQARMLAREWLTNISQRIPLSIWYDWHDDGTDAVDPEHHFGMVKFPYHPGRDPVYDPKPAYIAARTLTTAFKGYEFVKRLAVGDQDDYVLLCLNHEKPALAVWTTSVDPHELSIPFEGKLRTVVNHLGARQSDVEVNAKQLSFRVSDSPLYLELDGAKSQLLDIPSIHNLNTTIAPMFKSLEVTVENLGETAFNGQIRLVDLDGIEVEKLEHPISLKAADSQATIQIPWKQSSGTLRFGIRVEDERGAEMWKAPTHRYHIAPDWTSAQLDVASDGDRAVESEVRLGATDTTETGTDSIPVATRLQYRFGAGWRFLQVSIKGEPRKIAGEPTAFGIWIHGDGKSAAPRMRLIDATNQTWQIDGPLIDWSGWRFVELRLHPTSGHWGGANDGRIHYPLRWDSPLLLDNVSKKPITGTISFSAPIVIE